MTDHALLLLNLGSPASTEVADVRRYLNQSLMDPYVIDLPWPVRRLLVSLILLKRPADPEDIVPTGVFLAGPDSDYITGQIIPIEGGMILV